MQNLSEQDFIKLIKSVFPKFETDRKIGIIIDIPETGSTDNENWKLRREIAFGWIKSLKNSLKELDLEKAALFGYKDVGSNNADLPKDAYIINDELPVTMEDVKSINLEKITFDKVFTNYQLILAPTENSTTAPLKNSAKKYKFRAATMPGFSKAMISALKIDYEEVSRRVTLIKELVDKAHGAELVFNVNNKDKYDLYFDLRFRKGNISAGRFPEAATAGNLPSGETYIVPFEGNKENVSKTNGTLPVEMDGEVLLYEIKENSAISVKGSGPVWEKERDFLKAEPAYGNMAELGFGVLGDFGLNPINEILLDEKLGFHIAFGRSDHFGGAVGPADFSSPDKVIHLDQIYIDQTQPSVKVESLKLLYEDKTEEIIIRDNKYLVF